MNGMWEKMIESAKSIGFPAVVCFYLLVSVNPKLDTVIAKLEKLVTIMEARR